MKFQPYCNTTTKSGPAPEVLSSTVSHRLLIVLIKYLPKAAGFCVECTPLPSASAVLKYNTSTRYLLSLLFTRIGVKIINCCLNKHTFCYSNSSYFDGRCKMALYQSAQH